MLWIGGAPGAGKSTLAWRLSRTWDLPLHSVDLWSYDHQARLPERESLDEELARDAILAERIQRTAAQAHRPVVHVPADPDWPTIAAAIEAAFGPALRAAPRLPGGTALSGQRRYENQVAVRQGRLWARAAGFSTMPRYPFACECGISRCRATWPVAPDEYEARTVGQTLVLHDMVRPGSDRIGS